MWHAQDQKASSKTQEGLECYLLVHRSFCNNGRGKKGEKEIEEDQSSDGWDEKRKTQDAVRRENGRTQLCLCSFGRQAQGKGEAHKAAFHPKKGGAPLTGGDLIKHKHSLFNF